MVAVDQDGTGVTVAVREGDGIESLRAAHVIGADGAHSAVRSAVGIPMDGPDDLGSHLTVLFHAPLATVVAQRRYGLYMVGHPEAAGVFLPTDSSTGGSTPGSGSPRSTRCSPGRSWCA